MSRKVNRLGPDPLVREEIVEGNAVIRRAPLTGGGDLISEPDFQMPLVRIKCHCGQSIGMFWKNNRRERTSLPAFYFFQSQSIVDADAQPLPITRTVESLVEIDTVLMTSCSVHGHYQINVETLFRLARKIEARLAKGEEVKKVATYSIPRVSESLM